MARKPERNHEAYKKSGFLRTTKKTSKSSISFYTKIKVTKAESNVKLFPIEKKFFKRFFKRCIGGNNQAWDAVFHHQMKHWEESWK